MDVVIWFAVIWAALFVVWAIWSAGDVRAMREQHRRDRDDLRRVVGYRPRRRMW